MVEWKGVLPLQCFGGIAPARNVRRSSNALKWRCFFFSFHFSRTQYDTKAWVRCTETRTASRGSEGIKFSTHIPLAPVVIVSGSDELAEDAEPAGHVEHTPRHLSFPVCSPSYGWGKMRMITNIRKVDNVVVSLRISFPKRACAAESVSSAHLQGVDLCRHD